MDNDQPAAAPEERAERAHALIDRLFNEHFLRRPLGSAADIWTRAHDFRDALKAALKEI